MSNANQSQFYVAAVLNGQTLVYTGRAGQAYVSDVQAEAFLMGEGEAEHKAEVLNRASELTGLEFVTVRQLRHEGFKAGDRVKCWDFQHCEGRTDRFVVGPIIAVNRDGTAEAPFAHYVVRVEIDTAFRNDPRPEILAPMESLMLDFDNRIEKVPFSASGVTMAS